MVLRLWRKSKASRTGVARFWFLNVLLADFNFLNFLMTDLWLQGIYYDLLHICDLALYCDMYASSFLVWTVGRNIFDAPTKDERLVELYGRYMVWCKENRILFLFHFVWPFLYLYVTKIVFVFFVPPQQNPKQLVICIPSHFMHPRYSKWLSRQSSSVRIFNTSKFIQVLPCDWTKETKWCVKQTDVAFCCWVFAWSLAKGAEWSSQARL